MQISVTFRHMEASEGVKGYVKEKVEKLQKYVENPQEVHVVVSAEKFRQMAESELHFYLDSGEWAGAAGGYRIQERGAFFVEWIRGSYSNVVGLPLEAFYGILVRNEYQF